MLKLLYFLFWPFIQIFKAGRYCYKAYWLGFLFWLADAEFEIFGKKISIIGGRAHAKRVGNNARNGRLVGNAISLAPVIAAVAMIGITSFITGGAALALWGTVLLGVGIAINFGLLPICSAANTVDAQTNEDALAEIQIRSNKKAMIRQEPPHGIWNGTKQQQKMLLTRSAHDANGLLGTFASWAETISTFLTSIATVVTGGLFVASRTSALISATGASFTNGYRLSVYEQLLQDEIIAYYDHTRIQNRSLHTKLAHIINEALGPLNIIDHPFRTWVVFRCYCVVERLLTEATEPLNESELKTKLQVFVRAFCENIPGQSKPVIRKLSEKKLRNILANGTPLCVLDALPHLEEKLYQELKKTKPSQTKPATGLHACFKPLNNGHAELLITYIRSALCNKSPKHQKMLLKDQSVWNSVLAHESISAYLNFEQDMGWSFNIKKIIETWPVETSHGLQLIAPYHLKNLAELVITHICKTQAAPLPAPPDNQSIARNKALAIWDSVINPIGNKDKPEGKFDDHDPQFSGVMTFMIQYLSKELKTALDANKSALEMQAIENTLYKKLNAVISRIKETSVTQLILHQFNPDMGHDYLHPEKLPKAIETPESEYKEEYYETPWLKTSSRVVNAFKTTVCA